MVMLDYCEYVITHKYFRSLGQVYLLQNHNAGFKLELSDNHANPIWIWQYQAPSVNALIVEAAKFLRNRDAELK